MRDDKVNFIDDHQPHLLHIPAHETIQCPEEWFRIGFFIVFFMVKEWFCIGFFSSLYGTFPKKVDLIDDHQPHLLHVPATQPTNDTSTFWPTKITIRLLYD
jgi:hypothetical protein